MNKIIDIDFREEAPPVEIEPVTIEKCQAGSKGIRRPSFWLGWQLFRSE